MGVYRIDLEKRKPALTSFSLSLFSSSLWSPRSCSLWSIALWKLASGKMQIWSALGRIYDGDPSLLASLRVWESNDQHFISAAFSSWRRSRAASPTKRRSAFLKRIHPDNDKSPPGQIVKSSSIQDNNPSNPRNYSVHLSSFDNTESKLEICISSSKRSKRKRGRKRRNEIDPSINARSMKRERERKKTQHPLLIRFKLSTRWVLRNKWAGPPVST